MSAAACSPPPAGSPTPTLPLLLQVCKSHPVVDVSPISAHAKSHHLAVQRTACWALPCTRTNMVMRVESICCAALSALQACEGLLLSKRFFVHDCTACIETRCTFVVGNCWKAPLLLIACEVCRAAA